MNPHYPIVAKFPGPKRGLICASSLAGKDIPPRQWFAEGIVPAGQPTLITADGGTGKSRLMTQAAVAAVLGRPWLAWNLRKGPVIYLSSEDDTDELHRRLYEATLFYGAGLEDLGDLHLWSLADDDPTLALPGQSDVLEPTERWTQLVAHAEAIKPSLIVLDSLADVFGGNEIVRAQARQFVALLRQLAIKTGAAVVIIAHPSLSGMASGSGTSGSTHWSNAVRSRLYLTQPSGEALDEDPDIRVLSLKKSNYARAMPDLRIRSKVGGFEVADKATVGLDSGAAQGRVDRVFLKLMGAYKTEGRVLSDRAGGNFAPTLFARDQRGEGITKAGFHAAMNRLFEAQKIRTETTGPASRQRRELVLTGDA